MTSKQPLSTKAFTDALKTLNAAQREAVEAIEGPVLVVAGPGTGKTQILTLRIANILFRTDMKPENILALTFTESGARAMRERLKQYVGSLAYKVPIFTFHGFAERLIREYPDAFPRIIGGRPATDLEKVNLFETILDDENLSLLRPIGDPTYYVPRVKSIISDLKREYVRPDDLAKIISQQEDFLNGIEKIHQKGAHKGKVRGEYTKQEKVVGKNKELLFVYRRYEESLKEKRIYDFDDMIIETVEAMSKNEDLLRDLQESYQYVLADEHQDVNGAQNKILELLCNFHDSPNIFVVGDEKQAIYRFQGASLENFLYFMDLFPTTKKIVLTENYRSGQVILDAAHSLVEVDDDILSAMRIPLKAASVEGGNVSRRDFSHQAVEDDWLVDEVKKHLLSGLAPEEIAVIVRTNHEVEQLASRLKQAGVPVFASADGDVLDHPITKAIESLVNFVLLDKNESALFTVLHGAYWGLSTEDIIKISAGRSYQLPLGSILSSEDKLKELGVSDVTKALNIMEVQKVAREREVYEPPHRVLEYLLTASGFLDHINSHQPLEGARVIRRLYDEIEAQVIRDGAGTLKEVSLMFELRRRYNLPLQAPYIDTKTSAVQVMTAHKSKGLEFSVVFVPHLEDKNWGGKVRRTNFVIPLAHYALDQSSSEEDDEKRLFYVAMTRAKNELLISNSEHNSEGKDSSPSRLLDVIDVKFIENKDTKPEEEKFNPLAIIRRQDEGRLVDSELLIKLLGQRGFSATSLNNYLSNPWHYLYRNILRIPEIQPLHMQFGTVVHNVLQQVTASHTKHQKWPTDTKVKEWLEVQLRNLPVSQTEYVQLHEKGMKIIFSYLTHLMQSMNASTKEEVSIKVTLETGLKELPEIPLTGKLDRIDFDEEGLAVRVVDYKTGKPKTRNFIEGKTADADGGYKRQLVFYALLLSLYDDERYLCRQGTLSFVEPTISGVIKEESFEITDEEVEALKSEIITAVRDIIKGDFLSDASLAEASDYASLARQLIK